MDGERMTGWMPWMEREGEWLLGMIWKWEGCVAGMEGMRFLSPLLSISCSRLHPHQLWNYLRG